MAQPDNALMVAASAPPAAVQRGINDAQWRTLANNLYPGAHPDSILMVIDYCTARGLDPLKKPCHIVPMEVRDAKTNTRVTRDVIMPGIYEYRTTAHRTGLYAGRAAFEFGDDREEFGVVAPEWCSTTIYRFAGVDWYSNGNRERIEFPVVVYFAEVVALKDGQANMRWRKAPRQMLMKCTEAAGLRETFPEEFGGEATAEETDGQPVTIDHEPPAPVPPPQRKSTAKAVDPEPAPTPAAPKGLAIVDAERRRSTKSAEVYYWIVLGDRSTEDYFLLPEKGQAWPELVRVVHALKGTGRRVEFAVEHPAGQKWPTIIGIDLLDGAAV